MRDRRQENQEQNGTEHIWTLDEMVQRMGEHVNRILRENLYELRLNERQLCRLERQKKELRENLMRCGIGDALAKSYVLEFMQESLLKLFHLNEQTMDRVFYFRRSGHVSAEYLFDRLLYQYKKEYGKAAMNHLIEENDLLQQTPNEITAEQILQVYRQRGRALSFVEKTELLTWKVYSAYKGLGIIDELRDMYIDGVSGGVSGAPGDYRSVWIFYQGRSVHLSFLDFRTEAELERICRNICVHLFFERTLQID